MATELRLRAVAYKEGDVYVMQGIEYDITAHASDLPALMKEFERAVVENCAITVHLGRKPLAGIKPAPDRFVEMFEAGTLELTPVRPSDPRRQARPDLSVRYAEASVSA